MCFFMLLNFVLLRVYSNVILLYVVLTYIFHVNFYEDSQITPLFYSLLIFTSLTIK